MAEDYNNGWLLELVTVNISENRHTALILGTQI